MTDESLNVLSRIQSLTEITIEIYPLDGKHSHVIDKMQRLLGKFCKGLSKVIYTGALCYRPGFTSSNCELQKSCMNYVLVWYLKHTELILVFMYMERGPSDTVLLECLKSLSKLKKLKFINAGLIFLSNQFVDKVTGSAIAQQVNKNCGITSLSFIDCDKVQFMDLKRL